MVPVLFELKRTTAAPAIKITTIITTTTIALPIANRDLEGGSHISTAERAVLFKDEPGFTMNIFRNEN